MKLTLATLMILASNFAMADVGSGKLLECGNGALEIHTTALPKMFQATYKSNEVGTVVLNCTSKPVAELTTQYSCKAKDGGMNLKIEVRGGGVAGLIQASVSNNGKQIENLMCKKASDQAAAPAKSQKVCGNLIVRECFRAPCPVTIQTKTASVAIDPASEEAQGQLAKLEAQLPVNVCAQGNQTADGFKFFSIRKAVAAF